LRRTRYQCGRVERSPRKSGSDVWVYRFWERDPGGRNVRRSIIVGTTEELRTQEDAIRAATGLRLIANLGSPPPETVTFGALIGRYVAEEMPTRHSTKKSYMTILNKHIRPRWGDTLLPNVKPMLVHAWLKQMDLSPRYKGKIKALIHRLFEKAMFWELMPIQRNPMEFVEIKGVTQRQRRPRVLTVEEFYSLLDLLNEPHRTMVAVAQCLGLRVSEILALKWEDIDFESRTMRVTRAVVDGIVDDVKTEYSEDDLPLDPGFAALLLAWRGQCPASAGHWVFPSHVTGEPYHASPIQQDYIRPAGRKLGLGDIGWHTFRHTYRSWLDATGAPIGVQQKLMRHAQVATTMNVYGNALMESKREANSKIVQLVLGPRAAGWVQ